MRTGWRTFHLSALRQLFSRRQPPPSTFEEELDTMMFAAREGVYLFELLGKLGFDEFETNTFTRDNTGAPHLATNSAYGARIEHMAIDFQFLYNLVGDHRISARWEP